MTDTFAACDEPPSSAASTRCALCAPRGNRDPSSTQGEEVDGLSHALLLVSSATEEQAVARLVAEALRNGMVVIDARLGAEPRIAGDALPQRPSFRSRAAANDVVSDRRLHALLSDHAVVHLFITGSVTEAAVKQTALSALAGNHRVTFVDDSVRPHSSKFGRATKDLESRGAFTVATEEFFSLASAMRKADPLRRVQSRAPHRPAPRSEPHAGIGRMDASEDRPLPRSAGFFRKLASFNGLGGRKRTAWTAAVALAAAVAVWQGRSYIDIDADGAPRTTAEGMAVAFSAERPAAASAAISEDPAQGSVASPTERNDRPSATELAHDLAVLRIEFDTAVRESARTAAQARESQLSSERALAELTMDLRKEQERTASFAAELVLVRQEIDRQEGDLAKYTLALPVTALLLATARSDASDPPKQPSDGLEATAPSRSEPDTAAASLDIPAAPPGLNAGEDMTRLMARASQLLSHGDIGGARVVLERIAETGNVLAVFALAETYDPLALAAMGTMGTVGDAAKARDLYAVALAKGVEKASDRLKALLLSFPGGTP